MGELRGGYMIIWVQELTMMLQANLAQQWPTVLTGQGSKDVLLHITYPTIYFLKIFIVVGQLLNSISCFFYCVHHRIFSCGTSEEGESYLAEWNESEGAIKHLYDGLWKRSVGVVQFDTMKNRFLATGDEFQIKFWDMDDVNILTTTAAEGGLPVMPVESLFLMCLAVF